MVDAVALGEEPVAVEVLNAPRLELLNQTFEYKGVQKVKLPLAAAVYLLAQGLARLVEP